MKPADWDSLPTEPPTPASPARTTKEALEEELHDEAQRLIADSSPYYSGLGLALLNLIDARREAEARAVTAERERDRAVELLERVTNRLCNAVPFLWTENGNAWAKRDSAEWAAKATKVAGEASAFLANLSPATAAPREPPPPPKTKGTP